MNGNVVENKTSHSQDAFHTHIRLFPFSSRQLYIIYMTQY